MPHTDEYWHDREIDARQPGWPAAAEPVLTIRGANWTIPNRGGFVPTFVDGKVTLSPADPALDARADAILASAPVTSSGVCETCGHPLDSSVEIGQGSIAWLSEVLGLAADLLRARYSLADEELSELLTVRGGAPDWIRQLLWWCANG